MNGDNPSMEPNPITISLQDDSPGYEISPARVPLATLASFASDVRDFLKGTGKDGDADSTGVAIVHGSLAVAAFQSSLISIGQICFNQCRNRCSARRSDRQRAQYDEVLP